MIWLVLPLAFSLTAGSAGCWADEAAASPLATKANAHRGLENFIADCDAVIKNVGFQYTTPLGVTLIRLFSQLLQSGEPNTAVKTNTVLKTKLEQAWNERSFTNFPEILYYPRPLILLGCLRYLTMLDSNNRLKPYIGVDQKFPFSQLNESLLAEALQQTLAEDQPVFWQCLQERSVQTNDPSRSLVWRWVAQLAGADSLDLLYEIGASAGLNLVADAMPELQWTFVAEHSKKNVQFEEVMAIDRRVGSDIEPLDVNSDEDANWLRALVWPSTHLEERRMARLDRAIEVFKKKPVEIRTLAIHENVDDITEEIKASVESRRRDSACSKPSSQLLYLVFHAAVRQYIEPSSSAAFAQGMHKLLAALPEKSMAWAELENDVSSTGDGMSYALFVHVKVDGKVETFRLGTSSLHAENLQVDSKQVALFQAVYGPETEISLR